jgi:hypothetical protein
LRAGTLILVGFLFLCAACQREGVKAPRSIANRSSERSSSTAEPEQKPEPEKKPDAGPVTEEDFPALPVLDFATDPQWEGVGNRYSPYCVTVHQDVTWRPSGFAGGKSAGEIGGRFQRSSRVAYLAANVAQGRLLNSDDRLQFTARITFPKFDGGACIGLGFFNSARLSYPPANQAAVRFIDSKYPSSGLPFEWTFLHSANSLYQGFGTQQRKPKQPPDMDYELHLPVDGSSHRVSFEYDPGGSGGKGTFRIGVDDALQILNMGDPEQTLLHRGVDFRGVGATFDRFGVSVTSSTDAHYTEFYIDDVEYTAVGEDGLTCLKGESFDTDPQWVSHNNPSMKEDCVVPGAQDFGLSPGSHYASQDPSQRGELGGIVSRVEVDGKPIVYAGKTTELDINQPLYAKGSVSLVESGTDSGVLLGWFQAESAATHLKVYAGDLSERGPVGAPVNFFGISVEYVGGDTSAAILAPLYTLTSYAYVPYEDKQLPVAHFHGWDIIERTKVPKMRIDGKGFKEWKIAYDPVSPTSDGIIRLWVQGQNQDQPVTMPLPLAHKSQLGKFDRFGLMPSRAGGKPMEIYFDNLSYSGGVVK